jgi:threonine/homoserine/homoserine lactone efflux protein
MFAHNTSDERRDAGMNVGLLFGFWGIALLLALTPGADWAYAISAGLRERTVLPSILGMILGYAIVVALVASGIGAAVTAFPVILTVLTFVGALYLLWLGIRAIAARPAQLEDAAQTASGPWRARVARGVGVSTLNPKGLLLLLALLPQFTAPAAPWPLTAQLLTLGSIHLLNIAVVYTGVAVLARRILRARPTATVVVTRVSGAAMLAIGAALLIERVIELAPS